MSKFIFRLEISAHISRLPSKELENSQEQIVKQMAEFAHSVVELDIQLIIHLIKYSIYRWVELKGVNFTLFTEALPQERLVLASDMMEIMKNTISPFLMDQEQVAPFSHAMDNILNHYLNQFARR